MQTPCIVLRFYPGQEHQRQASACWSATLLRGGVHPEGDRAGVHTHIGKRGSATQHDPLGGSAGPLSEILEEENDEQRLVFRDKADSRRSNPRR